MEVIRIEPGEEGVKSVVGNEECIEFVVVLTNQRIKTGVQGLLNKEVLIIHCKELYS